MYFILQLGYFKSKHLFFQFKLSEVQEDIHYILKVYFKDESFGDFGLIDKKTRLTHIIEVFNKKKLVGLQQ
ncbi:hypothetical protein M3Y14_30980 (plasmid) [Bacillus thuringiensis]|nr:hypothetical protein [Bacillus thuringiensis]UYX55712.1 hypothetical protein M3Y14_30980 [Bacillus thuringiensis]